MRGDRGHSGSNPKTNVAESTQLIHDGIYFPGIRSLGIENRLDIVEDDEHLPGGKEGSEGSQILGVIDPCANNFREPGEEVRKRSRKLITSDESTVVAKPFLDAVVMKDGESN